MEFHYSGATFSSSKSLYHKVKQQTERCVNIKEVERYCLESKVKVDLYDGDMSRYHLNQVGTEDRSKHVDNDSWGICIG